MTEARVTHPDLVVALELRDLKAGQQRTEEALQGVMTLLGKILDHLAAPPPPPPPPIASYAGLYLADDEDAPADAEGEGPAPVPASSGPWRRLFAARSTRFLAGFVLVVVCTLPWWRLNLTASAPRGLWLRWSVPPVVERGMWVTLPAPASIQPWYPSWAPLLKPVAAVAGEQVCVREETLWIRQQAYGRVYQHDATGQPLPHLTGCVTVGRGEVFLASRAPQSLDSRYFRAVPVSALTAQATPLVTWSD